MKRDLIQLRKFLGLLIVGIGPVLSGSTIFAQPSESPSRSGGGVWMIIDHQEDIPIKDPKDPKGLIKSKNPHLDEVIRKHGVSETSNPLSNSKNLKLKKVIELRCKKCDSKTLKNDLELKGFGSKKHPIEIAPEYDSLLTPDDYSIAVQNDYALNLIQAQCAWDITTGSPSVVLGISDQNFYADPNNGGVHEELAGKVVNYDTTNTSTRTHGTAVATTAAGNTNNGLGKSSIGFNSKLGLYRMNFNQVIAAATAGIKVINMSWAAGCSYNSYAQQALTDVYNMGTFLIASAGNGTTCSGPANLVYPAAYDHVFAVTSIGPNNNHERFPGNPSSTHQHNAKVDLSAPGYDVALSIAPGWYSTGNGTSFAAPYVTGTVGLMLSINPNLTPDEIEQILKSTATNIDSMNPNYIGLIGAGRLNACAAVTAVQNSMSATITLNQGCSQSEVVANLTVSGGTAPFSYSWSNGATSEDLTGPAPGDYTVTVTDANGSTTTATVTVPTISPISISQTLNMPVNGNDGSIDLTVSPAGSYTYSWSNGSTSEDPSSLGAGIYSVTVTNTHGCSAQGSYQLYTPLISSLAIQQGCVPNAGSINLTVSGGVPPYSYSWSNGATTQDLNNLASGTYSVSITDQTGGSISTSGVIQTFQATTVTGQVTPSTVNADGSINLTASGSGPFTYLWSNGGTTEDLSNLAPGNYSVTATNANGCNEVKEFVVPLALTLSANTGMGCSKGTGSINLTVTGGTAPYTYAWNNGAIIEDLSNLSSGTYSVTVTDSAGATKNLSIYVPPYTALDVTGIISHTTNNLSNGSINVTVTGQVAETYSWTKVNSSFTATTEDLSGIDAGVYFLYVTSVNGCKIKKVFPVLSK